MNKPSPRTRSRLAALAIATATLPCGTAVARPGSASEPAPRASDATVLLLRAADVPGLVTYPAASGRLSLWASAEQDGHQRAILRRNGWRIGARRTFGQSPTSLYGVLVIESRVLIFASADGARRALPRLPIAGLHRVDGRLPLGGGARVFAHQDTVDGISELALATQFRQGNVISRVMIVGTPGIITRAHLLATARRQRLRVAQARHA
jgi:hypothetical protein